MRLHTVPLRGAGLEHVAPCLVVAYIAILVDWRRWITYHREPGAQRAQRANVSQHQVARSAPKGMRRAASRRPDRRASAQQSLSPEMPSACRAIHGPTAAKVAVQHGLKKQM